MSTLGPPPAAPDDHGRCAVCASLLATALEHGCERGHCRTSPYPTRFYAHARACVEYQEMVVDDGIAHRFYRVDAAGEARS